MKIAFIANTFALAGLYNRLDVRINALDGIHDRSKSNKNNPWPFVCWDERDFLYATRR